MMMMVEIDDVHKCLDALESGKDFVFIYENDRFRPFRDEDDERSEVSVILTPEWYDLTYCSNCWDEEVLHKELICFHRIMKQLNDEFISTKFTVVWR